jgi:hypothetical protein
MPRAERVQESANQPPNVVQRLCGLLELWLDAKRNDESPTQFKKQNLHENLYRKGPFWSAANQLDGWKAPPLKKVS